MKKLNDVNKNIIIAALLLILVLSGIHNYSVFINAKNIRSKTVSKLIELGATEESISSIPESDLKVLDQATKISLDKKYYYVPEKQCPFHIQKCS